MRSKTKHTNNLKKKREKHEASVNKLVERAEGGEEELHSVTQPTPWRGGAPIKDEEQHAWF